MNKKLLTYIVGGSTLIVAFTGVALAEDNATGTSANADVHVEMHASTTLPKLPVKGLIQDIKKEIGGDRGLIASTTKDMRERMSSTTNDIRGDLKGEQKDLGGDTQQMRFLQMARLVWIRINATLVRLQKIVIKLDTRIAKIKSAGGDTAVAENYSADAKTALKAAKSDTDAIRTIIGGISSTTPLDANATSTIKADSKDAEKQLHTAQTNIENALQSLQGLKTGLEINEHASTTSSVETH